ncbi:MAG TPA: glycerophosphodiester phosphodiesterase [Thermococcus paralvinellae]|uniref:Glycerophosphodiester phosphodiesterase n=1 Tax=Thermococcus paralvinellae TaxID=582419 RepID=A0A832ZHQ7_9EURY|nr:glycerophosphodiester phosphodiesterase [Thermococcus paralvinellae]
MDVLMIGHRGFKDVYPENTMLAFKKAIENGADGIEFDVWLTRDKKPVTLHDSEFKVDGKWYNVKELRLNELRRLHPYGKLIPTVDELFKEFPNAIFDVDVKDDDAIKPLLRLVKKFNTLDRVVFSSPETKKLKKIRNLNEEVKLGFSVERKSAIFEFPILKKELNLYSLHVPLDGIDHVSFPVFRLLLKWAKGFDVKIAIWSFEKDELLYLPLLRGYYDMIIADNVVKVMKTLGVKVFK